MLHKMQLRLGDKTKMIDSSLLHELFLQRLFLKVQMIVASVDVMAINKLAEVADRIMDVGTPTLSFVSRPTKSRNFLIFIQEEVAAAL